MALQPEPTACEEVLPPRVVDSPYSYQYEVCAPFGVTFPVTTAVALEGDTTASVTTPGAVADDVGFGVGLFVVLPVVTGVGVATVPGATGFALRRKYPPPKITSTTSMPIMMFWFIQCN